jgi:hypothetical protein
MAFITREDGVRFIVPSYRDTILAKKEALLKRELLLLSANYGEYATLQKKGLGQYEVAFSAESGYLLGECVWSHFKRPLDLIYCEAIPNTNDAILVIVKAGSVYLDGTFPLDSIPEELVIFKTQQNSFNIYIYGDVPIAENDDNDKFAFETASVKSFTVLDAPVFPTLPVVKAFQLQLIDPLLQSQGIGVLPIKQILMVIAIVALAWGGWMYIESQKEVIIEAITKDENPYEQYQLELNSPSPQQLITEMLKQFSNLQLVPGWTVNSLEFSASASGGTSRVSVSSLGGKVESLFSWVYKYNGTPDISTDGIYANFEASLPKRPLPTRIETSKNVLAALLDRVAKVTPGNVIQLNSTAIKKNYTQTTITYNVPSSSPTVYAAISKQLENLPLVLTKASIKIDNGNLAASFTFMALGN